MYTVPRKYGVNGAEVVDAGAAGAELQTIPRYQPGNLGCNPI